METHPRGDPGHPEAGRLLRVGAGVDRNQSCCRRGYALGVRARVADTNAHQDGQVAVGTADHSFDSGDVRLRGDSGEVALAHPDVERVDRGVDDLDKFLAFTGDGVVDVGKDKG